MDHQRIGVTPLLCRLHYLYLVSVQCHSWPCPVPWCSAGELRWEALFEQFIVLAAPVSPIPESPERSPWELYVFILRAPARAVYRICR